jgi:hypothetical protein
MSFKIVFDKFSKVIDKTLLHELLKEYDQAKKFNFLEDWEKSILHASEFSEMTLAVVKNIVDKEVVDINNIHFDQLCNELINRTKVTAEDEILMLAIPRAARSIYDIRNKKRVVHIKAIEPSLLDSQYCVSACDWILSQLVMLYLESDPNEVSSIIHSLIEKQVPFIEQFEDGCLVVLKEGLNFKEQFLVALYKLGKRVSKKELTRILKKYDQLINATSKNLENDKLVHTNENGVLLTKKGIKFVENNLLLTR